MSPACTGMFTENWLSRPLAMGRGPSRPITFQRSGSAIFRIHLEGQLCPLPVFALWLHCVIVPVDGTM